MNVSGIPAGDPNRAPDGGAFNGTAEPPAASARYRISHRTHYRYSEPVAICQNQLRMQPRTDGRMTCHKTSIQISPRPDSVFQHTDYFGNHVYSFAIESLHRELEVVAKSDVTVESVPVAGKDSTWDSIADDTDLSEPIPLRVREFRFDSPRINRSKAYAEYARKSFPPGRSLGEAALDLTRRIHADFKYDTGATDVSTPTDRAFQLRAGVCQDFAHIQIACLRSIGLPARYVSGYLRTVPPEGKPAMVGADESHAWLSVYGGDQIGWIGCDPTNACFVGTDHIPICVGRDYGDVSPMRGVVLGGGQTSLKVSVDVQLVG